jgi:hypothetical protein
VANRRNEKVTADGWKTSDIHVSECKEKGGHRKEEVVQQRGPAARVVLRGGEERRRLVLEA